jgi:hypothetical protein
MSDDDKIHNPETSPEENPVASDVTEPVINNSITVPGTEAVSESSLETSNLITTPNGDASLLQELGRGGFDATDLDTTNASIADVVFQAKVQELTEALTRDAGAVAADRLTWTPTITSVLKRANSVETSLLILLEILNVEIPLTQIHMESRSVTSTKLRIVGHGAYKLEHLLHAVMLGKVNIERMQRELTEEKRQLVDANRMIDQHTKKIAQLSTDIAALRNVPPPPPLDKNYFVLCYRDRKQRVNYLHCDEAGVYHRTRQLGKAMRFTSQINATLGLLDVLNHPGRNAFPKAYLLQFHSLHLINHSVANLSGGMAGRVGEAVRHAQQYEAERLQQSTKAPRKKSTRTRTEKEKPVERRRNSRRNSTTNKNRDRGNR